jgi:hypothetical protein
MPLYTGLSNIFEDFLVYWLRESHCIEDFFSELENCPRLDYLPCMLTFENFGRVLDGLGCRFYGLEGVGLMV